jgi:hypothetical protein
MSQGSLVIPNSGTLSGLSLVNTINAMLDIIDSLHSGTTDPGAIGAFRLWADTTNDLLKIRNAANSAWIAVGTLSAVNLGLASLSAIATFTKPVRSTISALGNQTGTVTLDLATANNFSLTATGNITLANPSNVVAGQSGIIQITQDGTGGRTLSLGSNWKKVDGVAPSASSAASAVDELVYYVESSTFISINYRTALA